ncbi:hypothetical protein DPMN_033332 [Dreissena polymorpha]|uniref:Uncharacterized protein n=2 Tax=Dreissena polymorpha TaxID=45954 RepID=A0A9D4RL18_DREPO|nr:hypothetical protein DPMN_033332 [Dreissena polymorpha]
MDVMCCGCLNNQVFTAFLCHHGCIVLWVFTTKYLLPFCVSMDVLSSVFTAKSLLPLCVSMDVLCSEFTAKSLLPFCVSMGVSCSVFTAKSLLPVCVSMDVSCSGCSQLSHYCLSVSARMYRDLGVHNQVITSFCVSMDVLCSGCSQPSHYCLSLSAWMYRARGVHNQVITAFLCQHGCLVLWVFTTKSLLPLFVSNIAKSPFYYDILAAERTIWGSP